MTKIQQVYGQGRKPVKTSVENLITAQNNAIFFVGAMVKIKEDYDDHLNDIYLEKGEEVKIIETSNNHVVAESNGDIIGHIPKKILEGFIDVCDISPAPIRYIFII